MQSRPDLLFDTSQLKSAAPYRGFCFPYAGGGWGMFSSWQKYCGGRLNILGVRLPGRGVRFKDTLYVEFESLLDDLQAGMAPFLDRPFILFGHSVGALIAYELARRRYASSRSLLMHLFVAACRAPHCHTPATAVIDKADYALDDHALAAKLAAIGGMPPEAVSNAQLLRVSLPAIRADLQVYDSYVAPRKPCELACSVSALGGLEDFAEVPEWSLREWRRYTQRDFHLRLLAGGHFFLNQQAKEILTRVLDVLP
jgi:medium-chain acyl-[acyl-carrier-protein] hydrolase